MKLYKQIWNERRANGWLWAELLIVFVVLWYLVDWSYVKARTYYEPLGFDITNTYYLELNIKDSKSNSFIPKEQKNTTMGQDVIELAQRIRRLPEVEAVSISNNARPYIGSNSGVMVRLDTIERNPLMRSVTPDFFEVFRYESADGRGYEPLKKAIENGNWVASENLWPKDYTGDPTLIGKTLVDMDDSTRIYKIGAVSKKVRYNDYWPNYGDRYVASLMTDKELADIDFDYYPISLEICFRVKDGTSPDFAEQVMKMSDAQFSVGNIFIVKVHNYKDLKDNFQLSENNKIKMRIWMMGFLLLNILLGIIGTFWFRTQYRRSELGLRIAVGSTRMQLWGQLNKEGLLLLTFAAIPAAIICFNIGYFSSDDSAVEWGLSRFLITTCVTYILMAIMIFIGIFFPALQAIRIQPADALHEE